MEIPVPAYLEKNYWWAYGRRWSVRLFDHQFVVNVILYGNYNRLRDRALEALGQTLSGRTLQLGCCYGDLTPHIAERVARGRGSLDVVDVLPIQLENLEKKCPETFVIPVLADSAMLPLADDTYDRVISFFLLHEQPPEQRRRTFEEVLRVLKPGGSIVIIDYAQHAWWHPIRPYLLLLRLLKPYISDVFEHPMQELIPTMDGLTWNRASYFGGLFQMLTGDLAQASPIRAVKMVRAVPVRASMVA